MTDNMGETVIEETKKRVSLTLPSQIAFFALIGLLSFLCAVDVTGILSPVFMMIAAALNAVLALSIDRSPAKLLLVLGVNLVAFALATFYYTSVILAVSALYPLAFGFAVFLSVRMGMRRAGTIVMAAAFASIPLLTVLGFAIFEVYGVLNVETINKALADIFEPVRAAALEMVKELDGVTIGASELDDALLFAKSILPATIAVCLMIGAYIVTVLTRVIANIFKIGDLIPSGVRVGIMAKPDENGATVEVFRETVQWRFDLDVISAVIFITAYILTILFASSDSILMVYVVAMNLVILLTPGFFYCGLRDVLVGYKHRTSGKKASLIVIILGAVMLFISPLTVIMLLCVLGVIVTFRENRVRRNLNDNRRNDK